MSFKGGPTTGYENDGFESDSANANDGTFKSSQDEKRHLLKLSIDFLAVKDMKVSANISV